MHLFILYNLQLEIINFLYKNLSKADCCVQTLYYDKTMSNLTTLSITDDSGFLAIVNADKYNSFLNEEWAMPQLFRRFVDEMNRDNLIIWSTGCENTWTVNFVNKPSNKKSFREFSKTIAVTGGQIFLTNFEDLTMSAQYENEKIPAKHNVDLYLRLDNGIYEFKVRQLFDPTHYEHKAGDADFEIVVQSKIKTMEQEIDRIFWQTE